jgi:hypothetical protein
MLMCLDNQTEILTSHGWKGIGHIGVGDCVPSLTDISTTVSITQSERHPEKTGRQHPNAQAVTQFHQQLLLDVAAPQEIAAKGTP